MANEKIFTIKIDGVEKSYKDTVKLVDALKLLDDTNTQVSTSNTKASKTSKARSQTLTEEEKAENRLAETRDKASRVISQLEKDQVSADLQVKERTKSLQLQAQAENTATNSIESMKIGLKQLREEFKNMDVDSEVFEKTKKEIEELDLKIKSLSPSTNGLTKQLNEISNNLSDRFESLNNGINQTAENTKGLLNVLQAGAGGLALLGGESDSTKEMLSNLGKVIMTVNLLQTLNNSLLAKGAAASKLSSIAEGIHTVQIRARAMSISLANKNTKTSIILQKALNLAQKASPLMWLLGAFVAVVGGITAYNLATGEATEQTKKYTSSLDGVSFATEETRDAHDQHLRRVRDLQIEYRVLIGDMTNYQAKLLQLDNTLNDEITKNRDNATKELNTLNSEYDSFLGKLGKSFSNYIAGKDNKVSLEAVEKEKQDKRKAILEDSLQKEIDLQQQHNATLKNEEEKHNKERIELQDKLTSDLKTGLDKELFDLQNQRNKALDEVKEKGYDSNKVYEIYAKKETEIRDKYTKQNADKAKQASDKAKQNVEKQKELIKSLQKFQDDTSKLEQQNVLNRINSNRELIKSIEEVTGSYEDQKTILREQSDENIKRVSLEYDELINKAKEAGVDVSKLTEAKNERVKALEVQLSDELFSLESERVDKVKEINEKAIQNRQQLIGLEMAQLDTFYNTIESRLDNLEVKNSGGIINVDATRKNIDEANKCLNEYLNHLQSSKIEIEDYYNQMLTFYDKDSIEYKRLLLEKQNALLGFQKQEASIIEEITANAKRETDLQSDYWKEVSIKIQGYLDSVMNGVNAIFDAANSLMQAQLDDANDKYDAISQKYDEIVEKREESNNRIQTLEEEAKTARGGRSLILQQQITQEMEANKQLADQEKRLAKEKEKQEKELAKKEKQQKKVQIMNDIISGVANTALGVTKALEWGFPLGPVFAGIIGALGTVQVGVMSKQLSKLENGGLLNGKRHSQGGMRVEGTNIEVEGGEYVINRESTNKNLGLIRYINNQKRELTPTDINSFFSKSSQGFEPPFKRMFEAGGQLPTITNSANTDNEIIADAIRSIKIEPKVSVTDINTAQTDIVKVDSWTGL